MTATRSSVGLAVILVCVMLPRVALLPFGGVVVDRAGARRVALASDAVSGLAQLSIGLLLVTGHLAIAPVAVAAAVGGAASAFGVPATLPLVSGTVDADGRLAANTYCFQTVLGYSPITMGLVFLPLPVAIAVTATITQEKLVKHQSVRTLVVIGLAISAVGAILLTQTGVHTSYVALPLPALILLGAGLGLSVVVAIGIGQQCVDPKDAGTAGAMNNVSQQIGSAIGVAVISTFVATATTHYLSSHPTIPGSATEAAVHGFSVGYWWAAGVYIVAAVICGLLIRPKTYAHHLTGAELGDEPIAMIG